MKKASAAQAKKSKVTSKVAAPVTGDCGRTLWIWLGIGLRGDWFPVITNCTEGSTPFKPPPARVGKPFELVWTVCICREELIACDGGYCEYNPEGLLTNDGCSDMSGCTCLRTITKRDRDGAWVGITDPINVITPCNTTITAKRKVKD